MSDHQALYPIATMCRVLEVSTSGYYAWHRRKPSARTKSDAALTALIREIHEWSQGTYGVPHMFKELITRGHHVNPKRVERLMREAGLRGVSRRQRTHTTRRDRDGRVAPDLVERDFAAQGPDQLWVGDITYVPTWLDSCILPWSSTPGAVASWAGPWPLTCVPSWSCRRLTWRCGVVVHRRLSITPTRDTRLGSRGPRNVLD